MGCSAGLLLIGSKRCQRWVFFRGGKSSAELAAFASKSKGGKPAAHLHLQLEPPSTVAAVTLPFSVELCEGMKGQAGRLGDPPGDITPRAMGVQAFLLIPSPRDTVSSCPLHVHFPGALSPVASPPFRYRILLSSRTAVT